MLSNLANNLAMQQNTTNDVISKTAQAQKEFAETEQENSKLRCQIQELQAAARETAKQMSYLKQKLGRTSDTLESIKQRAVPALRNHGDKSFSVPWSQNEIGAISKGDQ